MKTLLVFAVAVVAVMSKAVAEDIAEDEMDEEEGDEANRELQDVESMFKTKKDPSLGLEYELTKLTKRVDSLEKKLDSVMKIRERKLKLWKKYYNSRGRGRTMTRFRKKVDKEEDKLDEEDDLRDEDGKDEDEETKEIKNWKGENEDEKEHAVRDMDENKKGFKKRMLFKEVSKGRSRFRKGKKGELFRKRMMIHKLRKMKQKKGGDEEEDNNKDADLSEKKRKYTKRLMTRKRWMVA